MKGEGQMELRGPIRERILPVETMARWLIENGTDLGSEAAVMVDLRRGAFTHTDIDAAMDAAIDRARAIRQDTDTPLTILRDLVACAAIFACVFVWALPAKAAAEPVIDHSPTGYALTVLCMLVLIASLCACALMKGRATRSSGREG